jgi:TRAP-type transport system periplasmic protein
MNKIKIYFILLSVMLVFSLINVCLMNVFAENKTIRLSHDMQENPYLPTHAYALTLEHYFELNSDYDVEIYPNSVLGGVREVVEQVQQGEIQIAIVSEAGLSNFYDRVLFFNSAYICPNNRVQREIWGSLNNITKKLGEEIYDRAHVLLFSYCDRGGAWVLTNSKRPIRTIEDMKGLQFRAMDKKQLEIYESLGAGGVVIPFEEVYTSLQTGIADGQMNPVHIIISSHFHEVQKYATFLNIYAGPAHVVANPEWYFSLSDKDKSSLEEATYYASLTASGLTQMSDLQSFKELEESGIEVIAQSPEDFEEFRNRVSSYTTQWARETMGDEFVDLYLGSIQEFEENLSIDKRTFWLKYYNETFFN